MDSIRLARSERLSVKPEWHCLSVPDDVVRTTASIHERTLQRPLPVVRHVLAGGRRRAFTLDTLLFNRQTVGLRRLGLQRVRLHGATANAHFFVKKTVR